MPKLPANYVKAPSFDNPLRSTALQPSEHRLVLRVDEASWQQLMAASEREGTPPETLAQRALVRWLSEPEPVAMAARTSTAPAPTPRPSLRAQLIDRLQERLVRRTWVKRLLTMREVWREGRPGF
jgi:hypothetical protein